MGYTHYWYQRRDFTQGEWGQICDGQRGTAAIAQAIVDGLRGHG